MASFPSLNIDNISYGPSSQKSGFDDEVEASRNTKIYESYDTTDKERCSSSLDHIFEELGKSTEQRSFLDDSSSWDSADDSAYTSYLSNKTSSPTVSHSKFKKKILFHNIFLMCCSIYLHHVNSILIDVCFNYW